MNRTKIEWADYTINPIKGLCRNTCWYCYAKAMYKRFKWDTKIRLDLSVFEDIEKLKKPAKIFVCSTHEIMGNWIPDSWISQIIENCKSFPQHTFIFLTKNPERYASFEFPDNCWLGATVTEKKDLWRIDTMRNIGGFISVEPLLDDVSDLSFKGIRWVIIGGLTPKPKHKKEWVIRLLEQLRDLDIPVFIKDNCHYEKQCLREFSKEEK